MCDNEAVGKSKYCKEHKKIAHQKWLEKIEADAKERSDKYARYEQVYREAQEKAWQAWQELTPTPMVVEQHANMLDDSSPVVKQWYAPSGVCGYAFVNISSGTASFSRWLVKSGYAGSDSYRGGVNVKMLYFERVRDASVQSYEKACASAQAFCEVINSADLGVIARSVSFLD